ncbi:Beta-1,3-xylanase TXYA precursor [Legionella busanensis]|uniref:Beta-1,3-xylanase TXYA n=1 Tax=Legionella busanensis TaxID=190655 RepID=A0A378JM63_9GAMM|nr:hypothetical protein [Legionella busanensis]STX51788.1 Beta-1,3-xylanase TXYA precursor [Legionella busanensis]
MKIIKTSFSGLFALTLAVKGYSNDHLYQDNLNQISDSTPPPLSINKRLLLSGQNNNEAWDNLQAILSNGQTPDGGSIYYQSRPNKTCETSGDLLSSAKENFAFLVNKANQSEKDIYIQLAISVKDNPPNSTRCPHGTKQGECTSLEASVAAVHDIADGRSDRLYDNLIKYINNNPKPIYLLRLDYEVSSNFFCDPNTDPKIGCEVYKRMFRHLRDLINAGTRNSGARVYYVYHPVRGEYQMLYPGNDVVDWIGLSVFEHDLCLPHFNGSNYSYNGFSASSYVPNSTCNIGSERLTVDGNILGAVAFANAMGKPVILSESAVTNYVDRSANHPNDGSDFVWQQAYKEASTNWVNRLFGLINYNGLVPINCNPANPNRSPACKSDQDNPTIDLSSTIKALVYINNDFRYGFDGSQSSSPNCKLSTQNGTNIPGCVPFNTSWFNDARLYNDSNAYEAGSFVSLNGQAKDAFCAGLDKANFNVKCDSICTE